MVFDSWLKTTHKIDDSRVLTEAEYKNYYSEYLKYLEEHAKEDLTESFNNFLEIEKKIAPILVGLEGTDEEYTKSEEAISAIFRERYGEDGKKIIPSLLQQYRNAQMVNEEEQQEGESDEDYKKFKEILDRKNNLSREDEIFLQNRKNLILSNISEVRNRVKQEVIKVLSGENAKLDPDSYRRIVEQLNIPFNFLKKEQLDKFIRQTLEGEFWDRNTIVDVIRNVAKNVFIPLTVGGGIRTIDDMRKILMAGADKISINSSAVKNLIVFAMFFNCDISILFSFDIIS